MRELIMLRIAKKLYKLEKIAQFNFPLQFDSVLFITFLIKRDKWFTIAKVKKLWLLSVK